MKYAGVLVTLAWLALGHLTVRSDEPIPRAALVPTVGTGTITRTFALSPDGKLLATGGGSRAGWVVLWDAATGKEIVDLNKHLEHTSAVEMVAFSSDGKTLASLDPLKVVLWDPASRKKLRVLDGNTFRSLAFSPDGTILAAGTNIGEVRLWTVTTGKSIAILKGHAGPVTAVAFSPDGKTLISMDPYKGDSKSTAGVKIWNVPEAK